MSDVLRQVLTPLSRSAGAIEGAFLKAGEGLGQGLGTFERLNTSMATLSDELNGGALETAASSLDAVSGELLTISRQLPEDAATLLGLVASNEAITTRFERLLEHIRTMTIISRSARIEAVVFADKALGLQSFTDDIMKLTRDVQNQITICARDHAKICHVLKQISKDQSNLDRDYRDKLIGLADELKTAFATIRQRRQDSAGLVQDMAQRSTRITQAAGLAFVALQSGDSTRQRLEHIHDAMRRAIALGDGLPGQNPAVPPEARHATMAILCRLQEAQIIDAVAAFDQEAGEIDRAIRLLIDDTQGLMEMSHGVFGDEGDGAESFLGTFRARLTGAAQLIGTCEAARRSVAGVTANLQDMLVELHKTISDLHQTTLSIVLIGVNAGLKAVRLGPEGRSLIVIADELKRLATNISKDGEDLLPAFDEVQRASRCLGSGLGTAVSASRSQVDQEMLAIVRSLDEGRRRLDEVLKSLQTESSRFDVELRRVTDDFALAVSMNDDVLEAARVIGEAGDPDDIDPADLSAALGYAEAIVSAHYTMAREREIHAEIALEAA